MHVSYEVAQQIVDKAVEKSKQMGVKMCIAILDSGGNLKSFTRMDDAHLNAHMFLFFYRFVHNLLCELITYMHQESLNIDKRIFILSHF